MQKESVIVKRCKKLYDVSEETVQEWFNNMERLQQSCNLEIDFKSTIPQIEWEYNSTVQLKILAYEGLRKRGRETKEYKERLEYELDVLKHLKHEDYFLLVYDLMKKVSDKKINLMPGRGSVCGSLIAYCLYITDVDPIIFGTNFDRFLRKDKVKSADIDLDFSSSKRSTVIDIINETYPSQNIQIATFGYWKTKNLVNDLAKIYQLPEEESEKLKAYLEQIISDRHRSISLELDELMDIPFVNEMEQKYPKIITHFSKLWGQIRFYGTHASGVAITSDNISKFMCLVKTKDGLRSCFDMENIDNLKILKLDILGLETASTINDIEELTGESFKYSYLDDTNVYEEFKQGNTLGIFQFESRGGSKIMSEIQPDSIFDIIAANALNRPAPKELGMVEEYIEAKQGKVRKNKYIEYAKDSYGCLIYQETVMKICREMAGMEWDDVDRQIKLAGKETKEKQELREKFVEGILDKGLMSRKEAEELHEKMSMYLFNKGHAVGYSLIGFYQMYLKHYYPFEFYYSTLKHAKLEEDEIKYKSEAVNRGIIILPPNINATSEYSISDLDGNKVIQEGLSKIKGIGIKSAKEIEKYQPFTSFRDFRDRVPRKAANVKVERALVEANCFIFDEEEMIKNIVGYNYYLKRKSK